MVCETSPNWSEELKTLQLSLSRINSHEESPISSPISPTNHAHQPIPISDLIGQIRRGDLITAVDVKSYIKARVADLGSGDITDLAYLTHCSPSEVSDVIKFMNSEMLKVSNNFQQASDQSMDLSTYQTLIDQQLETFAKINPEDIVKNHHLLLSYEQMSRLWPFLILRDPNARGDGDGDGDALYVVELTTITPDPIDLDLDNLGQLSLGRSKYHALIVINQLQIVICGHEGYICQTQINGQSQIIRQYDHMGQQCQLELHYHWGHLKRVNEYQNGQLNGQMSNLIGTRVGLQVNFKDNQLHGLLKVIDPDRQVVYQEIWHQDHCLLRLAPI